MNNNNTHSKISKTIHNSRINWKKLLGVAMLGAFAFAPLVAGSTPAMADRDDRDEGYRYNRDKDYRGNGYRQNRDRDDDDDDNDRNRYRDQYRDQRNNTDRNQTYRDSRSYEGIVTNDKSGREFILRLDNGQRVQVRSEEREPRRLSNGDRVRVQGYFLRTGERDRNNTRYNDNVLFRATNVQVIRNNDRYDNNNRYGNSGGILGGIFGGNGNNRRSMSGVVTDVRSDHRVTVRIDGRDYDVETAWKINKDVRRGSRVQVSGEMRGNNITRAAVVADKNDGGRYDNDRNNNYGNNNYGNGYFGNNNSKFEFNGRVTEVDERDRSIRVRGDNGRDYSLRVDDRDELKGVSRGDRVRVRGQVRNGTSIVDDVDKI